MHKWIFCLTLSLASMAAWGAEAQPVAADPKLEKHVMALAEELRCLVCQNQTIADSHAELAVDLRNQVREKLQQGMSDQQVIDYMVARYGDFVLYRPPVKGITWLLWFGPALLLAGGAATLGMKLARPRAPAETLPQGELDRAADLLGAARSDTKETR